MSRSINVGHTAAILEEVPGVGVIRAAGTTVPTDATAGFAPSCIFQKLDGSNNATVYVNEGTVTSCDFNKVAVDAPVDLTALTSSVDELNILTGVTATAAEINYLDQSLAAHTLTRGTGVDGSEGYHSSIARVGGIIVTQIYANIDDLVISATDLDILGESATANCHWGQITTAKSGTIFGGKITCLEVPTGGSADLDFYSSDVATGTENVIITDAALGTETALVTAGGAWTASAPVKTMTGLPTANDYIYIVNGAASGNGTFTAGKFLIEFYGV
jgi:hypothetical protein